MKIRNLFLAILTLSLVSCNSNTSNTSVSSSIPSSDSSSSSMSLALTKKLDSKIYLGSLATMQSLPCYFFNVADDVPYVSLKTFVDAGFNALLAAGNNVMIYSDNVVTNSLTQATLSFDVVNNTISCSDWDQFKSIFGVSFLHEDPLATSIDTTVRSVDEKCSRVAGKVMNWNLDKYYMKLVSYQGETYVPYSIMDKLFHTSIQYPFVFNGNDFYLTGDAYMFNEDGTTNDYGTAYYSGPLYELKTRSDSYARYFYGSFLFTMENFNGKISSMSFSSLDDELENKGLKTKILSTDSLVADEAIAETINTIFPDGGHTVFSNCGLNVVVDTERDKGLTEGILKTDERVKESAKIRQQLLELRGQKTENLKMSGETAIITLDGFNLNDMGVAPTKENVDTDTTSTFAILYNSFKTIQTNSNIRNVVIDVSVNPGGAAPALGETLGFLTNDDLLFTTKNTVTEAINKEYVRYDTDLDGDFTDDDSYEGKYEFYILTSGFSFSCANALPCLAKDYGYAKIIGQRSGGGDCIVGTGSTVDGTSWKMSSTSSIIRKDGSSVDDGAAVDYELDYSHFYDADYIDSFLKAKKSN